MSRINLMHDVEHLSFEALGELAKALQAEVVVLTGENVSLVSMQRKNRNLLGKGPLKRPEGIIEDFMGLLQDVEYLSFEALGELAKALQARVVSLTGDNESLRRQNQRLCVDGIGRSKLC